MRTWNPCGLNNMQTELEQNKAELHDLDGVLDEFDRVVGIDAAMTIPWPSAQAMRLDRRA